MDTTAVISDPYRAKITADRTGDGGILLRGPKSFLLLSVPECERLAWFITGKAHIQRYPAVAAPDRTEMGE